MRNEYSKRLLDQARSNAQRFERDPNVVSAFVTGSVAHGIADEYSDIDTCVILDQRVSAEVFEAECAAAIRSGGGVHGGSAEEGFAVYHYIDGVRCDFGFNYRDINARIQCAVLDEYDVDPVKQLIVRGIRESEPLCGSEYVLQWRRDTDIYPADLARAMLAKHMRLRPIWVLDSMGVARNDKLFLYEMYMEYIESLAGTLFGLNRAYHPGKIKGARRAIDALALAPTRFYDRLEELFTTTPKRGVADVRELAEEVFTLVETHMPDTDVAAARKRFTWNAGGPMESG